MCTQYKVRTLYSLSALYLLSVLRAQKPHNASIEYAPKIPKTDTDQQNKGANNM